MGKIVPLRHRGKKSADEKKTATKLRFRCGPLLLAVGLCHSVAPALAQMQEHAGHQGGPVPREILERPVPLRTGIGTLHEKVSTTSAEAQAFYDQGLAYVHSFVWIEAIRSFHQALRNDPNMGMAYLGLCDAYIGLQDVPTARAALERGEQLENHLNAREKTWLAIRKAELEVAEDPNNSDKYFAYRKTVNDALSATPSDPWLWIQRGLADESSPLSHGQAGGVDTLAFYKTALTLAPGNLAALHYYAHTWENLGHGKEALEETEKYAQLAPAIPHARHMHGHGLMRLGRTQEAIKEFLKTQELEEAYYKAENIPARFDWHHAHNLQLLALAYRTLGKAKTAEALLKESFDQPAYTEFLDYNRRAYPEFLLNRGRFEDALAAARHLSASPWPLARLAGHTIAGEAFVGLNRIDDAKDELRAAERETDSLPPRVVAALPYPISLRANLLLADKQIDEGRRLMVELEKSIVSMPGPDAWCAAEFELESLAEEARRAEDWDLARFMAEEMIKHNPQYAGGHFALGLVAEHAGESAGARQMFSAAEKLWSQGDADLPELALLRAKLRTTN